MSDKPVTRQDAVFNLLASRAQPSAKPAESALSILAGRIREFGFIPIISGSLRLEHIFAQLIETLKASDDSQNTNASIEDILAKIWAQQIGYPISDRYNLAQVAQYHIINARYDRKLDIGEAKKEYQLYLKQVLLNFAQNILNVDAGTISELTDSLDELSFTDIVKELDLPKFDANQSDPLRILANLPIPIYMTTSSNLFIEQALEQAGKHPCTQLCLWSGTVPGLDPLYEQDAQYRPDVNNPLVYHLFGLEKYNTTLIVSEDDYLEFLVRVTQDTDTTHPLIPLTLRSALAVSSLVMLGYRLDDWDCRVLLRGLLNSGQVRQSDNRPKSVVLQLTPSSQQINNAEMAKKYLEYYFKTVSFDVEWSSTTEFLDKLQAEWNRRR